MSKNTEKSKKNTRTPTYATKKDLEMHKKEVKKMIKESTKSVKKWDIKQDKQFAKKKPKAK